MVYRYAVNTPLGAVLLAGEDGALTGLWFEGQKHFPDTRGWEEGNLPVLLEAERWLSEYFAGRTPGPMPAVRLTGTPFQVRVWSLLREIPRGEVRTYGELARTLEARQGAGSVSPRAVGTTVSRNPVSILVPCHRVVGAGGSLTGYAGGLDRKRALLLLEGRSIVPAAGGGERVALWDCAGERPGTNER